jgi:hypothetical protein
MSRDHGLAICTTFIGIFGLLSCLLIAIYSWLNRSAVFRPDGGPIPLIVLALAACLFAWALYRGAKRWPR